MSISPRAPSTAARQTFTLDTNDQMLNAAGYDNLIIAYRNGAPVRVRDIGRAVDGAENDLLAGWHNNKRAMLLLVKREPGANVIETVRPIKAALPQLEASIPPAIKVDDRVRPHADHPRLGRRRAVHPDADDRAWW